MCLLFQVAFPVALFVYRVLFRIHIFGVLQVAAIFIILGIGADDVFVYTDALTEQDPSAPEAQRFSRAYRSAMTTMLTTSLTTSLAFAMTAVNKIPTVRYFGVFTALLVRRRMGDARYWTMIRNCFSKRKKVPCTQP